jgi:hypothetical protein
MHGDSVIARNYLIAFAAATAAASLAACATTHATAGGTRDAGAPTARKAVDTFLAAIRAQDLQAISMIWGTERGPARDVINRDELERREIIMVCFFNHDKAAVGEETPGEKGRRIFAVTLTKGQLTRTADFTAVPGPSERWFVENGDILKVREFCRNDQADSLQFQMVQPHEVPSH